MNRASSSPVARPGSSWGWWAVVGLFSLAHVTLLLVNWARVPPTYGYDWPGHLTALFHVAALGRMPGPAISPQFFNPPLYYNAVVGFARLSGIGLLGAGQVFNLLCAGVAWLFLVLLGRELWRDRPLPMAWLLAPVVLAPTTYRAYAMVRPEPLLLPLFAAAYWLVARSDRRGTPSAGVAAVAGLLAGVAAGTRQWGWFLEAGLGLWLLMTWRPWRAGWLQAAPRLAGHLAAFLLPVSLSYAARGGSLVAFNAPLNPSGAAFLLDPALRTLLTSPVRPFLNDRFWAILYADSWGDYWRYWRDALGRDSLATAAATIAALRRAVWAAIPATGLIVAGLALPGHDDADEHRSWARYARLQFLLALAGFLAFSWLFAGGDKGDTVKSVYVAYLLPLGGWAAGRASAWLARRGLAWAGWASLIVLVAGLAPLAVYQPPARLADRSLAAPPTAFPVGVTFGGAYTLIGYDAGYEASPSADEEAIALAVTLVWRADDYTGRGYKVFVHALDAEGALLAQSDAVPANWTRPTTAWMLGEYIVDRHVLRLIEPSAAVASLAVGIYAPEGSWGGEGRLLTADGRDSVALVRLPAGPPPEPGH